MYQRILDRRLLFLSKFIGFSESKMIMLTASILHMPTMMAFQFEFSITALFDWSPVNWFGYTIRFFCSRGFNFNPSFGLIIFSCCKEIRMIPNAVLGKIWWRFKYVNMRNRCGILFIIKEKNWTSSSLMIAVLHSYLHDCPPGDIWQISSAS